MAPSLLSLSVLAASLAGVLVEPSDNGYIGNNGHWTPKFAATAWKAGRRGSDNNGVHVFFSGSNGCSGIQLATLSTDHDGHGNNHHGRANPGLENQGNNVQQQQQQGGNNQNQQNRGGAQNQNQNNQNSQNQQQQQQDNQNQNQNNQNGQVQENTFSVSDAQNNRDGNNNNNVNVNNANVNNFNSQTSFWTKGYCFSNSAHNSWRINTDAAFAVTSIGGTNDVADMRLFYWSTTGRGNTAVLKDAYYTRSGRGKRGSNQNENHIDSGRWKSGKLSKTVSRANLGSLAATSWTKDGKVGRTVFYVQGGYLRELTLDECDDGHGHGHGHGDSWDDEDRDGVELHFNPGEMSAVSWFDDKGVLHKRVYVRNTDTNQVIEYTWSYATPYTAANNLYATSFIETGAGSSAASLQVSRGKPNLYLWTVGPQGGAVKEDNDRHGKNAKSGTQLAAATAQGSGGASYVFFLNKDGRLTQSNRDGEGKWHENLLVKMQNVH